MNILLITLLTFVAQASSIQGIVLRGGSSDPLGRADVELRAEDNDGDVLSSMTTEEDGRFRFQNISPGRYRLTVTRQGYFRPPLAITLTAGQAMPLLQLSMTPTAAIYGRVYDSKGEPVGNIEVQALKASYPEGRRELTAVQSVQTNDLGEYRLFWLPPGRYYVSAVHPQAQSMMRRMSNLIGAATTSFGGPGGVFVASSANGDPALNRFELEPEPGTDTETDRYIPIYFPGTPDEQTASAIDLRAGADFGGVNIAITPVRARHVRGIVVDGMTGKPAEYARIQSGDGIDRIGPGDTPVEPNSGSFDLALLPGLHTLTASATSGTGYATVRVGDADIENLTIATMPAFNISGRISLEGAGSPPRDNSALTSLRLSLRRDPPPPRAGSLSGSYSNPLPDGSFTLEGGLGDFRVNVAPLQNAYVKSIRLGSVDVLNNGLHLERPPATPLEVVIGANPGAVEGNVVRERPERTGDASVVLVPDVRRRSELYRVTPADSSGRFQFDRVPPGDYKLFAWEEVESGAWYDPEFLRGYENRGQAIRIVEGQKQSAQVPVIPAQ